MPRRNPTSLISLAVVAVLAVAFSFLPPSLIETLPPDLQDAARTAGELRRKVTGGFTEGSQPRQTEPRTAGELPTTAGSFSTAKRWLYEEVYAGQGTTFYCGCDYNSDREVDLQSCGMEQYAGNSRAERVEAEHVFPASQFGNFRKCWREPETFDECHTSSGNVISGRSCCERVDPVFEAAHNDLHNLFPAVGNVNGQRSNYNWGMVPRSSSERYGDCDIRIDSSIRRVQPPDGVRGDIARTMFYMRDIYGFRLSRQDEQLYTAWNREDSPDAWEIERDRRITKIQGISNPYVSDYERLARR